MRPLKVPKPTVSRITAGPATLRLGPHGLAGDGWEPEGPSFGSRQAGGSGVGRTYARHSGSSCQPSRAPAQPGPGGPGLSQLPFVTGKLETLSAPERCGALTTSAHTCPGHGELAQPGAARKDSFCACALLCVGLRPGLLSAEWLLLGVWSSQRGLQAPAGKGWRWWVPSRVGSAGPTGHSARCPGQGHTSSGHQEPAPASSPALGPSCERPP